MALLIGKFGDYAIYSNGQWYQLSNSSFGWGLTGNAGTSPNTNYIGTSDVHDLSIRADAQEIIRVLVGGGINVTGDATITGDVVLTNGQKLVIKDGSSFYTALKAGVQSANITYTLPATSGVAGATLVTDGSDNLSWKAPISILAGSGLTGGGNITATRTISMPNVGTADTYGSASQVPVLTTDGQGRVSAVTNTSIAINGSQVTSGVVAVQNGGTGLSTLPSNGQLLIGNGTGFTESTLSTGSGISVVNGSGTITINNAGVLTVGASAPIASSGGQNPSISLNDSGVIANTYGTASSVSTFTVTAKGLITSASNTSISIDASQITSGTLPIVRGGTGLSSAGASGNILVSNGTSFNSVAVTGDVALTSTGATTVNAVSGMPISGTPAPSVNDVLVYNGTNWAASSIINTLQTSYQTVLASEAIAAGDVCYIVNSGGSGANPTVARAQANSLDTVSGVIGLATTAIAKNATGTVQTYGQLIGPVDTHTFGQGDPLYVSATVPGGVTNVKPKGPNYTFQIGIVTRQGQPQNATTGIVFVSPIMQTDTENISDLVITTPIDHDSLMYDPASLTWKNIQPLWVPSTQTALILATGATITAANFANITYLPIKTAGGASITLSAVAPIAALTKTAADYGRELWLYNADNNRNITIPTGGTVKVDGGVNLVMTPGTIVKFLWTGLGGNGAWIQSAKAVTVA